MSHTRTVRTHATSPATQAFREVPVASELRSTIVTVMSSCALLLTLALPAEVAHAETAPTTPTESSVSDDNAPDVAPGNEPFTPPQIPEGSFDIPDAVVSPAPPSVEPIVRPPVGDAVATWRGSSPSPEVLDALRRSQSSKADHTSSSAESGEAMTKPQSTVDGQIKSRGVETRLRHARLQRERSMFLRRFCAGGSGATSEIGGGRCRPSSGGPRPSMKMLVD